MAQIAPQAFLRSLTGQICASERKSKNILWDKCDFCACFLRVTSFPRNKRRHKWLMPSVKFRKSCSFVTMIIRGTNKLLRTSGIKPVKNTDEITQELPGEWYAGLVSTGKQGKLAIHFNYIFSRNKKYMTPKEILDTLMIDK